MNLLERITGVIRRPRRTFHHVIAQPDWVAVLALTTILSAAAGATFMATPIGQQALVDQWERTATAFGQHVDDAEYARLEELSGRAGVGYAVGGALLSGPVVAIAVAGLAFLAFGRRGTFRQVLAVTSHAGVILALRQIIAAPLAYLRESTTSTTSLASFLPALDEASAGARFLGALDLFVLWWAVVLAVGFSVLYQRRTRPVALTLIGIYAVLALVLTGAMVAAGS